MVANESTHFRVDCWVICKSLAAQHSRTFINYDGNTCRCCSLQSWLLSHLQISCCSASKSKNAQQSEWLHYTRHTHRRLLTSHFRVDCWVIRKSLAAQHPRMLSNYDGNATHASHSLQSWLLSHLQISCCSASIWTPSNYDDDTDQFQSLARVNDTNLVGWFKWMVGISLWIFKKIYQHHTWAWESYKASNQHPRRCVITMAAHTGHSQLQISCCSSASKNAQQFYLLIGQVLPRVPISKSLQ